MNELKTHQEYVERNPEDRTAALALVDRYQEEIHISRGRALRKVVKLRRPIVRARESTLARRFTHTGSRARTLMVTRLRLLCGIPIHAAFDVIVVLNRCPPHSRLSVEDAGEDWYAGWLVFVSSRWILGFLKHQTKYPLSKMQKQILGSWQR